jgi:class 3 adenylate cyclase
MDIYDDGEKTDPEIVEDYRILDPATISALHKMPVDAMDGVYLGKTEEDALTLCVDIRNFSKFLVKNEENVVFNFIRDFSSNFLSCVNQFGYGCSYYKLMGDGAIIIWDNGTDDDLREALTVFTEFLDFSNEYLFIDGLALGGALVMEKVYKYEISAEISGLKYRDYVGYGINLACRLQNLAKADELIIGVRLAEKKRVPVVSVDRAEVGQLKGLQNKDREFVYLYNRSANTPRV